MNILRPCLRRHFAGSEKRESRCFLGSLRIVFLGEPCSMPLTMSARGSMIPRGAAAAALEAVWARRSVRGLPEAYPLNPVGPVRVPVPAGANRRSA